MTSLEMGGGRKALKCESGHKGAELLLMRVGEGMEGCLGPGGPALHRPPQQEKHAPPSLKDIRK